MPENQKKPKKIICAALLAHVDAGKTTLSEALLYRGGAIKAMGRVDHRDTFLDTASQERQRGITIFSKQANFTLGDTLFQLLDTPGHVDFSAETERTLQVLDYAILVISGTDGVQAHTRTLWQLLTRHKVPTFLFVNKMDLPGTDKAALMKNLQEKLSPGCVDFSGGTDFAEQLALCSEELMEKFLADTAFTEDDIARAIAARQVFPCCFGSALKLEGIESFLDCLERYTRQPAYPAAFGALVYKIGRDPQGNRLTHCKITGGTLKAKTMLNAASPQPWAEKADQLRIYNGAKFIPAQEVSAGTIVAITGLTQTTPGQGLGGQADALPPQLIPVLNYQILLPEGIDPQVAYTKLKQLEEEDPQLHLVWDARSSAILVQLMGQVQLEILQGMIGERFGWEVDFGQGSILYKETITDAVEGIGHFEPLRHYAETHLLLEPLPRGSGLILEADLPTDQLDLNWQRLILTHLAEKQHLGVLTGSPITDMKISLVAGRAHLKHTEGGDFRQATYRAVRNGLMKADSVLLEPWYRFTLELPQEQVGRAMSDLQKMGAEFSSPELSGESAVLTGSCPVSTMQDYSREVAAYSRGLGRLSFAVEGYQPCHNSEEVIAATAYDPVADLENTPDSVFCSHGAGYNVPWDEVAAHAHLGTLRLGLPQEEEERAAVSRRAVTASDAELQAVFDSANYRRQTRVIPPSRRAGNAEEEFRNIPYQPLDGEYLLVDGYNIIFAWDDLNKLARVNLAGARDALITLLENYQGYKKIGVILVFDAYLVPGGTGEVEKHGGLYVVYTKEAETADSYIERTTYQIGKRYRVRVATSDGAEQAIILGNGALRMSANMLRLEMDAAHAEIARIIEAHNNKR